MKTARAVVFLKSLSTEHIAVYFLRPLPDSPPESEGSEPYSPPDGHRHLHIQGKQDLHVLCGD